MMQDKKQAAIAFLESIPDIAGLIDTDENVLMINKAGAESLGRSADEIIGRNAREIIFGNVYELRRSKWTQVIQTGKTCYLEDERDGKYFETWFCPVFDANGKVESIAVFAHDITNHKKTEKALRQSEEKFRLAMEATNDALWDWNMITNEVYRNPRHATMLGYEPQELTASQEEWEKRIHPDDRQAVFQMLDEHLAGKRDSIEIEYRLRTKAGDYKWVLGRGKVVAYNDDGSPARMIGTNIDITDRKNLLERDEIMLKTCIDGFWVIDTQGKILEVNDAYCRMSGYSRDELLTMKINDVEALESPQETFQHIHGIVNKGSHRFESRHRRKDGTIMDLDISAHYLELDGGRMFTFFRDITEHKKAAKALRESEATYRTLVEQLPAITYRAALDEASTTLYVSPQVKDLMGFTVEEYKSDPDIWRKQLHPDDKDRVLKTVNQCHIEKKPFVEEYRMIAKNGGIVWFRDEAVIVKDEKNQPLFLQGIMYDISRHKHAEELLQESELRYHTLFEILPVGVGLSTMDGQIIGINNTFQQMLGYSMEEISKINTSDTYYNPADRPPFSRQLQQDGSVRGFEVQLKRKNGTKFLANLNATIMRIHGESVIVTVARDVTERRRMERALAASEEKYRTLVECAEDPIFTLDEKGVFLFANKQAEKVYNYLQDGLVGKTLWDLLPKKIADQNAPIVQKVIETKKGINGIFLNEIKGEPHWYNVTIEPLRDDRGNVNAAMVIARNIDNMKQAEEQIKKLSSAIESSINGILIGDIEGNLTFVNNSFLKMWGYKNQSEVLGRNAAQFWKVNEKAAEIENALQNGKGWIGELTAVRKDGSLFDVQVCQTSVRDEDGAIVSLMASFIDITESKRREEELTRYREQMARAEQLASLGTLSATIAHQLTQPLTVIRLSIDNALDELESSSSSQTVIRRLKDSVNQVSNITSIIERFRNFARKSSGRTVTEVNLKAIAVRIAGLLSESARSTSITLRIRNMDDLPCTWMNENDLEQLFFALIGNAIQAADGKKTRQLVISGAMKDKFIELRFSDDCGGITPENIDKIFEPFFTTKPPGQGTGLGLCIVKDIVSRIGGHVHVESKFGKGATFIINIPVEKNIQFE